jgi:hypothetical protein
MTDAGEPFATARRIGSILDEIGVAWMIGGSFASFAFGEPRSTIDIDVAVELHPSNIGALEDAAVESFFVDGVAAREAVMRGSSFNLLPREGSLKVDVFTLGDGELDRIQVARRRLVTIDADPPFDLWITSPDVMIVRKLMWFRLGHEVSDRQWRDVLGMINVQRHHLDAVDLARLAELGGVGDLLARTLAQDDLQR